MENRMEEELKKVLLAGIGATAMTAEKSAELLKELVEKGELTVRQGKVLNQELRHAVREKAQEASSDKKPESGIREETAELLKGLTDEQMEQLKALLLSFRGKNDDGTKDGE